MLDKSEICCLNESKTVFHFLNEELEFSKAYIKRQGLNRKYLEKKILRGDILSLPIDFINKAMVAPSYVGPQIEILYEDSLVLVLNKPCGIHSHPLQYSDQKNCLSFMREKGFGKFLDNFNDHEKGLLYRLDKVTSGVLVYVKCPKLHTYLRENYSSISHLKRYWAIVQGKFECFGTHQHEFSSKGVKGSKMQLSSKIDSKGQVAISHFSLVKYIEHLNLTWINVDIETGIRHQIRAQLAALGHPILGDTLYGGSDSKRVFLHAYKYELKIDGKLQSFCASKSPYFTPSLEV